MATNSSTLAWRAPQTEEPGGPQSMGSPSWTRLGEHTHSAPTHTHLKRNHCCFREINKIKTESCSGFKKQESRPPTDVWSAWTTRLLANTPVVFSKSNSTFPKRGSGSWNFLKPLETCPAPRVQKKTHKMKHTAL